MAVVFKSIPADLDIALEGAKAANPQAFYQIAMPGSWGEHIQHHARRRALAVLNEARAYGFLTLAGIEAVKKAEKMK
jgi:hypothetical protein